ncbi:ribonuclease III domain-containing protein [Verrucomicrobiales bacterium]|nr:ribonuclease III domain-containing protein [Verrucomicrobiales bacterium]
MKNEKKIVQEQAWIGDAVLGLFSREWILREESKMDAEMFARMTSNRFLNSLGNPTQVEAIIGRIYEKEGLQKAFYYLEEELIPLFLRQEKKRISKAGGKR